MKRLMHERMSGIKSGYWSPDKKQELVDRLAEYENTGLTPEEIKSLDEFEGSNGQLLLLEIAKHKWVPCSKRLPEESGYYMACIHDEKTDDFDFRKTWFAHKRDYDMDESEWRELYDYEKVTAWMPLPEPYREAERSSEG